MARPFPSDTRMPEGDLDIQSNDKNIHRGYFTPPQEALLHQSDDRTKYRRPIFDLDLNNKFLIIYPFHVWGFRCMEAKYYTLERIRLDLSDWEASYFEADDVEGFFSILPGAFVEDYHYGLGFKKNYKPIVSFLENLGLEELHITHKGVLSLDTTNKKASISRQELNKMTKGIDNIRARAQRISSKLKTEVVDDMFFEFLHVEGTETKADHSNAAIAKFIKQKTTQKASADKEERANAVKVMKEQGRQIASEHPEELIQLRKDIELVTLEELIARFEERINKNLSETHWQKLLNQNPFILNMAFGVPVIKVEDQAAVGGGKFSGSGGKIADFLMKNSLSGNAAVVEIKTPGIKLLSAKEYRGGMFAPSSEINGAVNQMLDQIYMLQNNFNFLKANSRDYSIESFAVTGILIAGKALTTVEEKKSFELFRGNSKNVQIILFDELLEKLKQLYNFLAPASQKNDVFGNVLTSEDPLPF